MDIVITIVSGFLLLVGSFLCISGGIGLLRFPDFYTRMHAVGAVSYPPLTLPTNKEE